MTGDGLEPQPGWRRKAALVSLGEEAVSPVGRGDNKGRPMAVAATLGTSDREAPGHCLQEDNSSGLF